MKQPMVLLVSLLICALVALGCSGGAGNPALPGLEQLGSSGDLAVGDTPSGQDSQTHLWGYYQVFVDVSNQTATAVADRSAMFTANVTTFLNTKPAGLAFKINGTPVGPDYVDVDIDVTITHPFPGLSQYNGYDVRGVFMGDGSASMQYNGDLVYPILGADQFMLADGVDGFGGPDGYTRWFNYTEFLSGGMPLFSYTPGKLATPGFAGTATLNPYKYFADGLGSTDDLWTWLNANSEDNGVFSSGASNTRNYYLRFPDIKGVVYGYAVLANWESEDVHPSNAVEAVGCSVTDSSTVYYAGPGDNGGSLILDVGIFGWEHQPSTVFVESTVLSALHEFTAGEMVPIGGDDHYSTYHVEVAADAVSGTEGNEFWVIAQYDDFDYANDFGVPNDAGEDPLAALFRYDLYVSGEPQCPDPTVVAIEPDFVIAGAGYEDVAITGTNLLDGSFLAVKLTKTGQADIVGTNVQHVDNNTIAADFDFSGAAEGFWDVFVTNGCGSDGTGEDLLEVYSCGTLGGFTQDYHAVILFIYPGYPGHDMPTYLSGVAATQTGTPYAISIGNRPEYGGDKLGAIPLSTMNYGPPQYMSPSLGRGVINRDVVCDSQNNVYFTGSLDYSLLSYCPFDASTGFGSASNFANIDAGWMIWRITIDENDNPVVLAYQGNNMRVYHWNSGSSDWDTTDVPSSVVQGNYQQIGDFDWNPHLKHYVFTRYVNNNQCNLYAIDQSGDLKKEMPDIFGGAYCTGLPGIYIDVNDPACRIATWGSFSYFGIKYGPFTRMTAAYSDPVTTSIGVGNWTSNNLNLASPRGQVAGGSPQLCVSVHYINVYAKVPLPSDW